MQQGLREHNEQERQNRINLKGVKQMEEFRVNKGLVKIALIVLTLTLCVPIYSHATEIDFGNSDITARFNNTIKYSVAARVRKLDEDVSATNYNPNIDAGDHNFDRGLISNRFDLLSEFDLKYKRKYGLRLSAAAWYDFVYNDETDSDLVIPNALSVDNDEFTKDTEKLHGRKAEMLDYFVFGSFRPLNKRLSLKVGQFAQLYGETLFFGANGVAAAQATPDIIKLLSVPNSQFKEILRPVEQISANLLLSSKISLGAYYQFEWERARLPGAGSYFSFADFADEGGEVVFFPDIFTGGPAPLALLRGDDIEGRNSGQGGVQLKIRHGDVEYGLYATRHHDKTPQFYFRPVDPLSGPGSYALVYAQDIETYGFSVSTLVGDTNIAAELSYRRNTPMMATGNVVLDFAGTGDGRHNPLYPVGETWHLNMSAISVLAASPLWDGASFIGEVAFNYRDHIEKNADQLDPNATRSATAARAIFEPEYFQVLPGLDLKVPIGVGYGIEGRSSVLGAGAMPPEHGGDVSLGVKADFRKIWQAGLNYTHYFGDASGVVDPTGALSYDQFHRDRDFISFSVQRTF
jgi:hypothetical protein